MTITKQELLDTIQLSINMYNGNHGKVIKILDTEIREEFNGVDLCTGWLDDNYYIVFRGTHGGEEWKGNFKIEKKIVPFYDLFPKAKCHKGFLDHYSKIQDRVWERLYENINQIREKNSTIYITGHSLGGITATLCADDLQLNSPYKIKVITYGSPRGFDFFGARDFNKRFNTENCQAFRYIYRNDIVSKVPTTWLGFKHTGNKIWGNKMKLWEIILHPIFKFIGNPLDHYPEKSLAEIKKLRFKKIND